MIIAIVLNYLSHHPHPSRPHGPLPRDCRRRLPLPRVIIPKSTLIVRLQPILIGISLDLRRHLAVQTGPFGRAARHKVLLFGGGAQRAGLVHVVLGRGLGLAGRGCAGRRGRRPAAQGGRGARVPGRAADAGALFAGHRHQKLVP